MSECTHVYADDSTYRPGEVCGKPAIYKYVHRQTEQVWLRCVFHTRGVPVIRCARFKVDATGNAKLPRSDEERLTAKIIDRLDHLHKY